MDDSGCFRALQAIGIDMAHHIMADFGFPSARIFVVQIICMSFQFVDHFLCNHWFAVFSF